MKINLKSTIWAILSLTGGIGAALSLGTIIDHNERRVEAQAQIDVLRDIKADTSLVQKYEQKREEVPHNSPWWAGFVGGALLYAYSAEKRDEYKRESK